MRGVCRGREVGGGSSFNFMSAFFQKNFLGLSIFLTAVVALAFIWGVLWVDLQKEPVPPSVVAPSRRHAGKACPPDVKAVKSGKETYTVMTDSNPNPRIEEISFDPLDPKPGEQQVVTVKVINKNTDTITDNHGVKVSYQTDSGSTNLAALKMIHANGQDIASEDIETIWQKTFTIEDSYCDEYVITVIAENDEGEHKVDITVR